MNVVRHLLDTSDKACFCHQLVALENVALPQLSIAFGSVKAIDALAACRHGSSLSSKWVATSSCLDAFSDQTQTGSHHLALLQFIDTKGSYGVSGKPSSAETVFNDSKQALHEALEMAKRPGELPALIWCSPSPGLEEGVLAGIKEVVGDEVPVFGGSCADDDVTGNWCLFDGNELINNGFIIAVLFPDAPISFYFSCGYEATAYTAEVTASDGRKIISLDNQPAADVYNDWRRSTGMPALTTGAVLAASAFNPLGRVIMHDGMPFALLAHPAKIDDTGAMCLFAEIKRGERVTFMRGDSELLVERAASVSDIALKQLTNLHDSAPLAAIVIFCAGCMLAIPNDINRVHSGIKHALGKVPFIGGYTFGEQGRFADGANKHGNLMISAILFGSSNE